MSPRRSTQLSLFLRLAIIVLFVDGSAVASQGWRLQQFAPHSRSFVAVAEKDGHFVAVDDELAVVSDGENTLHASVLSPQAAISDVAANGQHFVAVACLADKTTGVVLASSNGKTWRERFRGPGCFRGVAWGNEQWLALGTGIIAVGTADLGQWTSVAAGEHQRDALSAAVWAGDQWIAVGTGASNEGWISSSPDGYAWSTEARLQGQGLRDVAWNGSLAVAVSENHIWSSDLGSDWSRQHGWPSNTLIWDGQRFVAMGTIAADGGSFAVGATSADGFNWVELYLELRDVRDISFDGTRYLATGERTLAASTDLVSWTPSANAMPADRINILLPSDQGLVAVGPHAWDTTFTAPDSYLGLSEDGELWQWEKVGLGCWVDGAAERAQIVVFSCCCETHLVVRDPEGGWSLTEEFGEYPHLLAAGDPGFVMAPYLEFGAAPDAPRIYFSPAGAQWSPVEDIPLDEIKTLEWVNGSFVAFARNGIARSTDGLAWEFQEIADFVSAKALAGDGHRMVRLVGMRIEFSDDGATWRQAMLPEGDILYNLAWTGDSFVAVGNRGSVAVSRDGEKWLRTSTGWPFPLYEVHHLVGSYVVGGDSAVLVRDTTDKPRRLRGRH